MASKPMLEQLGDPSGGGRPQIWWSNTIFFLSVHFAALVGVYCYPAWAVKRETLVFAFLVWQLADFGITIGYHRLYSHKAFRANIGVRALLAILGSAGFQGSIKWWCLRHRLHHRYTDDPVHDPYAATRGLFYSHMGWIFFKPTYERMKLVEQDDLERDPVVRLQHKYYVPVALTLGFVFPPLLGLLWEDPVGSFVWAGIVSRLFIWHCTFLVNSLAHKDGLQPYSDEDTSRGNLLLAILTGGEGNHNFHTFPHDFRSGPSMLDWDPSKWIILALNAFGWVHGLRRAKQEDVKEAAHYMHQKYSGDEQLKEPSADETEDEWQGPLWGAKEFSEFKRDSPSSCLIFLDGFVVDATPYLREHPGGASLLRSYSSEAIKDRPDDAQWAFYGGLNKHSRAAKNKMRGLRIAKLNN